MPKLNRQFQQLDQAAAALTQYQNYLAQIDVGNREPAKNELRNFMYTNARARLVPQSWITSKMKENKNDTTETDKLLASLTVANLSETIDKIQVIANNDSSQTRNEYYGLLNDSRHLQAIEMINKTRGPVEAYNRMGQPGGQHQWRNAISTLALNMQTQYAAKILSIKIEVTNDGSPESTLNNLLAQFAKEKNWPGMAKVLELIRNGQFYGTTSSDVVNGELSAARNFLVADQMEKMGQKEEAIKYYIETLKFTSDRLPLKEAADRLTKLKSTP